MLIASVLKLPEDDINTVKKVVTAFINQNRLPQSDPCERTRLSPGEGFENKGMIHQDKAVAIAISLLTDSIKEKQIQVSAGFLNQFCWRFRVMAESTTKYRDLEDGLEEECKTLLEMGQS
jgi:hypothetical protein